MERRKVRAAMQFKLAPGVELRLDCRECCKGCHRRSHGMLWQIVLLIPTGPGTYYDVPYMRIRQPDRPGFYECPVAAARPAIMKIPPYE